MRYPSDKNNSDKREVSISLSEAVIDTARSLGVSDTAALIADAGIDKALFDQPDNRIPFVQQQSLWELAIERAASPTFGLHFARNVQATHFGLLGYMIMNCQTISDCLEAIVKYQFLSGQGGEFSLERTDNSTALCYVAVNTELPVTQHRVVAMIAAHISFGRWLLGPNYKPDLVEFSHACPEEAQEYRDFFEAPVLFQRTSNKITFNTDVTSLKIPLASADLLELLSERADRLLANITKQSGITGQTSKLLLRQMGEALPSRSMIAMQLGLSERTLQRRLNDEGTSYQAVLNTTRYHIACDLLKNTVLPLSEVAAQLGFSEPSAFYRTFKRQHGITPGQYRDNKNR
jgi:AraC-like DNA-binding protein